ncbi:hypothetical protein [Nocardia abscessus]|uniref:hypothetical protein n=1 Tax=Nocardia abscessus TaxID=120957 RepID=UPI002455BFA3|nr:hypothetical protein [Nocardia abscessus]
MTDRTADAATVDIVGATTAEGAVTLPLPAPLGGEDPGTLGAGRNTMYATAVASLIIQGISIATFELILRQIAAAQEFSLRPGVTIRDAGFLSGPVIRSAAKRSPISGIMHSSNRADEPAPHWRKRPVRARWDDNGAGAGTALESGTCTAERIVLAPDYSFVVHEKDHRVVHAADFMFPTNME